jgi:hypothetical protein
MSLVTEAVLLHEDSSRGGKYSQGVSCTEIIMKHLGHLREQAETACKSRGHSIEWSAPYHGESQSIQHGCCNHCDREVQIIMNPRPNQIDVGGEAVALNCN